MVKKAMEKITKTELQVVVDSIIKNTKEAYKESILIDNENIQDLLLDILTNAKKVYEMVEEKTVIQKKTKTTRSVNEDAHTRYTDEQVRDITKVQLQLAKDEITLSGAERAVKEIAKSFPIQNLKQYNTRLQKVLSGVGQYGFAFPANWAEALLKETNNDELVVQAFKQQLALYLEKDGTVNKKLDMLINSIK